jgi:hypothetical protein
VDAGACDVAGALHEATNAINARLENFTPLERVRARGVTTPTAGLNSLGSFAGPPCVASVEKLLEAHMVFLAEPDITPITNLITTWIHIGQALVASIGALAFIFAFIWKITAVESKSALAAKQWIQRIVVGTIGVEVAGSLVGILTSSVPTH